MTTRSAAQALQPSSIRTSAFQLRRGAGLRDEQLFAKLCNIGMQGALAVLLSVFGLGSVMAQSIDQDMTLGANTQATRDRVISELRQARADGTIKRWSPIVVEVPFKRPLKGSRFEPFSTHRDESESSRFESGDSGIRSTNITIAAPQAAQ
jgi:hypothetical protein